MDCVERRIHLEALGVDLRMADRVRNHPGMISLVCGEKRYRQLVGWWRSNRRA